MRAQIQFDRQWWRLVSVAMLAAISLAAARAQSVPQTASPQTAKMPAVQGTELDRVDAVVNDQLILDSDVDQEKRFEALQPYRDPNEKFSRPRAIERLIDRDLILQQAQLQPQDQITDAQVNQELDALRKTIPDCKQYHCETQAGWDSFLAANGFTEASLTKIWRQRMEVLRFIEQRFRAGIRITPEEIKAYYEQTMLPEYAKKGAPAPKLDSVSDRIQEVLLERRVSGLLDDWLKSLRAQGSVVVLHQGEEAP